MTERFRGVRAVVFDIGNTLVDATSLIRQSATHASEHISALIDGLDAAALTETYLATSDIAAHRNINRLFSDPAIVSRTLRKAHITANERNVYTYLTHFRLRLRSLLTPNRPLRRTLLSLRANGLRLCALSDGTTAEQYEVLGRLRLLDIFEPIIVSETFGREKTSPVVFRTLARILRVEPRRIAMVGDDLRADMYWAKRAGFLTVHQREFREVDRHALALYGRYVDMTLTSIQQLQPLLEPLRG